GLPGGVAVRPSGPACRGAGGSRESGGSVALRRGWGWVRPDVLPLRSGWRSPPLCGPPPPVAAVRADRGALRGAALSRPGVARRGRPYASVPGMGGRGLWLTELSAVPWALVSRSFLHRKSLYCSVVAWWVASW